MSAENSSTELVVPERYRLLNATPIGSGAMGVVYKAWDTKLDRTVALKLLQASSGSGVETAPKPDIVRAIQEARALAKVSHSGILQVFDVIEEKNRCWIVTEWLDGKPLDQLSLPMHPASVAAVFFQVLNALASVHETGVVHRDLKPSNIVLCASGRVVLLDFGVAFIPGGSSGSTIAGTLRYCDPQRLEGVSPTQASDVFSAALVGFELLTGAVVVPELAPLPLHRFLTRELGAHLRACGDGHYPPLVSLFERMALSGSLARKESLTAAQCAQEMSALFHAFTSESPDLFLSIHVVGKAPIGNEVNEKIQQEIAAALKNSAIAPKTRAAWMAFVKTASTHFMPTNVAKGSHLFRAVALWLIVSLGVAAGALAFLLRPVNPRLPVVSEAVATPVATVVELPATPNPVATAMPTVIRTPIQTPRPTVKPVVLTPQPAIVVTPGVVSVYFSANAWAVLYIDGKKEGQLPMAEPLKLSTGRHRVRMENPMAETFEGVIEISPGATPVKHHFRLTPRSQN